MQVVKNKQEHILSISGALHLSEAGELRRVLAEFLQNEPLLQLDLSAVGACDAASMQLLCSLRNSARMANKSLRLIACSEAVSEAGAILGLAIDDLVDSRVIDLGLDLTVCSSGKNDGD